MVSTTTASSSSKTKGGKTKAVVHNHPKYETMVTEAIETLGERTGSSGVAIRNYLTAKKEWELPNNFAKSLSTQLKKMVVDGKLKKVKASYKLSDSLKNKMKKPAKKSTGKKSVAKKSTTAGVKVAKKKAVAVASTSTAAEKPAKTKKTTTTTTTTKSVGRPKKSTPAKKAAPVKKAAAAKKAATSPKKPVMKRKAPAKRGAPKAKKTTKK